jgi:hypothetical protein
MRFRGDRTSGAVTAQQLLNEGQAHPEEIGNGPLRARLTGTGLQDLLT